MIRLGILGYGNLGRGVECAVTARNVAGEALSGGKLALSCVLAFRVLTEDGEEVRALTQELAQRAPGHFLGAALLIELLSHPGEAFDQYGKYVVKNGLLHRENAAERANRVQIMRALGAVRFDQAEGRHIPFSRKDALTGAENNLRLANNKAEDLSIKKLTKNSPSVRARFENLKDDGE